MLRQEKSTISSYTCAVVAVLPISLLFSHWGDPEIGVASVFLAMICIADSFFLRIPNFLPVTLLVTALGNLIFLHGLPGVGMALQGFAVGFLIFLIPYLLGWLGGGDLKATAALGAFIGPLPIIETVLLGAVAWGGLALFILLLENASRAKFEKAYMTLGTVTSTGHWSQLKNIDGMKTKIAYAPALSIGYVVMVMLG